MIEKAFGRGSSRRRLRFGQQFFPLTAELLHEQIGDYYFDNQSDVVRSVAQKRRLSASYWKDYNAVGHTSGEAVVDLEKGRRCKCFGRVDLEREPYAQDAGEQAHDDGDSKYSRDTLGIEHEPPWKVRSEHENKRQPGDIAGNPQR